MVKSRALILSLFVLAGCKSVGGLFGSSPDITPGSERVRVFDAEPKGCLYVGEISSVQEDKTVGTLETEMDLATRIDLRNKAHALGGNILVFLKGKNSNTLPGSAPVGSKTSATASKAGAAAEPSASQEPPSNPNTLVFLATVFKCPSSVLNQ
ncbi:MAG: DUF4156 domain-containing protein [Pseudobdellovibrio sp.]